METSEALKLIGDKEFINKIYQFSYSRCNTSFEAEDLCSDIVLEIISAVRVQQYIENFYAFVWKIARRVYADHCKKNSKSIQTVSIEDVEMPLALTESVNEIDNFIEGTEEAAHIRKILTEIAFLSKAYREVMILYYIDEMSISGIASKLQISETTVKQRLFSARSIIRKEVKTMEQKNLSLKPVRGWFLGTGDPIGNNPAEKVERILSRNLIYLCKNKPKSPKELSEELSVPMPYIEEELYIQCHGLNGEYGMLRKLENGKYVTNVHIVDYDEYKEVNDIYKKYIPEICGLWESAFKEQTHKILSFPYLSPQDDVRFIFWALINNSVWNFKGHIGKIISEKYFTDMKPVSRSYSVTMVVHTGDTPFDVSSYGCDGILSGFICGYDFVHVQNLYGNRIDAHFHCGHDISNDGKLILTIRSIGGLPIDTLTEAEKEEAAKAIECGYIKNNGKMLVPKIVVIDRKNSNEFPHLTDSLNEKTGDIAECIAREVAEYAKKHIPAHLINEYNIYTDLIAGATMTSDMIDACVQRGLLTEPESRIGAEGVVMYVGK